MPLKKPVVSCHTSLIRFFPPDSAGWPMPPSSTIRHLIEWKPNQDWAEPIRFSLLKFEQRVLGWRVVSAELKGFSAVGAEEIIVCLYNILKL